MGMGMGLGTGELGMGELCPNITGTHYNINSLSTFEENYKITRKIVEKLCIYKHGQGHRRVGHGRIMSKRHKYPLA